MIPLDLNIEDKFRITYVIHLKRVSNLAYEIVQVSSLCKSLK